MRPLQVVIIDDEPSTCSLLEAVFAAEGHECRVFVHPSAAERYLASNPADLAMVDIYLGATNGIDLLHRLRALQPDMYAVIMTAHASMETAARALTEPAVDYVSKPISPEQIRALTQRVQGRRREPAQAELSGSPDGQESLIVGRSPKMVEVYTAIGRVARSDANVLITGASGTGKELVARAIHQHSRRAQQPFTPVNCGSFAEAILESELFGHEKGAFTGADRLHKGLVEATDGGTLFLDEVTETSLGFQVKLLRVIQEQQVRRVGSTRYIPVNIRILAASNGDVPAAIRSGQFREDLYYRLSVVHIAVPSLEERREDIPLLVARFLQLFNGKNGQNVAIEPAAVQRLQAMPWPGNVRELENTVNRLAIFAPTGQITLADVDAELSRRANDDQRQVRGSLPHAGHHPIGGRSPADRTRALARRKLPNLGPRRVYRRRVVGHGTDQDCHQRRQAGHRPSPPALAEGAEWRNRL